jgi:hypothetical protein
MMKETNRFKKIEEQASFNVSSLAKRLARFYSKNPDLAYKAIIEHLETNPQATKRETFRALSDGRGTPKSHASGKKENTQKIGCKSNGRRTRPV